MYMRYHRNVTEIKAFCACEFFLIIIGLVTIIFMMNSNLDDLYSVLRGCMASEHADEYVLCNMCQQLFLFIYF